MNILFINPPWLENGRQGIRAGSRWPHTVEKLTRESTIPFPFYLAYAAALLRKNGFRVAIIDGVAECMSLKKFFREAKTKEPDLIIFETSTPSYNYDLKIAQQIKDEFKNIKLIFCGTHPSVFPHETLSNPFVDFVLIGEYEFSLLELVQKLSREEDLTEVKGLALKKGGEIKINARRPLINLDELPYPVRDLLPVYKYNDWFCKYRPNVQLHASRGCVYSCPFCAWPRIMYGGANYRIRPPEKVVDEIEILLKNYTFKEFYFDDDTFNINKKYVEAICDEIKKRGLKIVWSCMGHIGNITKEFLEKMKASGCEGIKFGVETGSRKILKYLHKGITLEQIEQVFKWCREIGIRTHATLIFGLPGETKETIKESINFLLKLDSDSMQVSIATPLPGTLFYEEAREKAWLLTEDWSQFNGAYQGVIRMGNLLPKDLKEAEKMALASWRAHQYKKYKLKYFKRAIRNPLKAIKAVYCLLNRKREL